jgi:hypothetical protein
MSNLYKGPSIDASYQVSVHLAEGFQRRRLKCEKLTDDGRQMMAKSSHCLWQGELKMSQESFSNFNTNIVFTNMYTSIYLWKSPLLYLRI